MTHCYCPLGYVVLTFTLTRDYRRTALRPVASSDPRFFTSGILHQYGGINMTGLQSPQDDFEQKRDAATPGQDAQPQDEQPQDVFPWDAQPQVAQSENGQQKYGQPQNQQVQPYQQQPVANLQKHPATGLTSAQRFWYIVSCIAMGAGYFAKIPPKKALADFGMAQLTPAQEFWYILQCCAFGAGYFKKLSTAKALSEMPQFRSAGY
jgi:hypothetical protein